MAPLEPVQARLIWLEETALAVRLVGAAGATLIPDSVPVMAEFALSVAVIDWLPAVLSVTVNVCVPWSAAVKVIVRRQAGLDIAAGEVDRAPVAGVRLPLEFWAVTVRLNDVPAVSAVGAVTTRLSDGPWTYEPASRRSGWRSASPCR